MRPLRFGCLLLGLILGGIRPVLSDVPLTGIDCSLSPARYAAGLLHPLRPVDLDNDGNPEQWLNKTNPFGNVVACGGELGLPCYSSHHHHTGEDLLLNGSSISSQNRQVHAVDNGVVVFSTNGQRNPNPRRAGLVVIKHVAPPGTYFEIPAYRETLGPSNQQVKIFYDREFVTELVSYYLHLGEAYVKQGDAVAREQVIGRLYTYDEKYANGYSYVPHLHFELWRGCTANDSDGYEPFGRSDFPDAVRDQLLMPTALREANAANKELVRIVPVQLPSSGNVQISGAGFGTSPGVVWVSGKVFPHNSPQLWPIIVDSTNWTDSEIRLNLYQGPLASPLHLISPLLFEVDKANGDAEGTFLYPFKDVEPDDWFSGSVINLWKNGLVEGANGLARYLPDEPIKRSEFVKLLALAVCPQGANRCDPASGIPGYTDVKSGDWFYEPVRTAWSQNWIDRTQAQFRPHDPIARSEVAKIIALVLRIPLQTPVSSPYSDVHTTDWFAPYVVGLTDAGYLNGYSDRSFQPGASITRAEAASLIDRVRLSSGR